MIKSGQGRIWIILVILLTIGGLALLFGGGGKRHSWKETYLQKSKDPYGTHVIKEMLRGYFPDEKMTVLIDSLQLPDSMITRANYVFIGEGLWLDSAETRQLQQFVRAGNQAFIASRTLPLDLIDPIYYEIACDDYWVDYATEEDTIGELNFVHPSFRTDTPFVYRFWYHDKVLSYRWQYIPPYFFCERDSGLVSLGYLGDSLPNFARIPYGKGEFLLHTVPLAFTNIQMMDPSPLAYADRVFSHLSPGPIYWDEYSKVSEAVARRRNSNPYEPPERRLNARSPLQYVLAQPSLTWAWYLLLIIGLLYLTFQSKRRQRIVPVLEPNANTSLEFLGTIGRLYYLQGNHQRLAVQKMRLFQAHIRTHYGLHARQPDEGLVEKLSAKSEIPTEQIREIFRLFADIEAATQIDDRLLIRFHRAIESFYLNSK